MASKTLEELEAEAALTEEEYEEVEEAEDSFREELANALTLLSKCTVLFNYLSDVDLCKAVSKRERDSMNRVVELINDFSVDVENKFAELGDEE